MALRIATANTDWALRGDRGYLRHLCRDNDVILLQEAKDTRIADFLPPGWTSLQDVSSPDRMGSAIAVRDAAVIVKAHGLTSGTLPFIGGRRIAMLRRWIAWADLTERATGDTLFAVSAHLPPWRFRPLQRPYARRLRKVIGARRDVVIGTDANQPLHNLASRLGFEFYGEDPHGNGIVGLLAHTAVTVSGERVERWGIAHHKTDHPAISATVTLPHAKKVPVTKTPLKPPSPPFIAARHHGGSQTPKAIVMHGTVSSDRPGNARSIALWWNGSTSPTTSAHYVVDPSETVQCVGDHTVAYHCGYNTGSIAIELCDEETGPPSRWADTNSTAIIQNAAELVANLCLCYGIEIRRPSVAELHAKGPHGIYGHNDSRLAFGMTTHSDPIDFPWPHFLSLVNAAAAKLKETHK